MKKFFMLCLVFCFFINRAQGQEFNLEAFNNELRKNAKAFELLPVVNLNIITPFEIKLGATSAKVKNVEYDGFRFKAPEKLAGADFVWYFNVPKSWGNWYILPMSKKATGGFQSWLHGDKVYENFDNEGEENRTRILQKLGGSYFEGGKEYLIWFRKTNELKSKNVLKGVLIFTQKKKDSDWKHEQIEKALGLEPKSVASQVVHLKSRGGEILLDKKLFNRDDAKSRINDVFFSLRNTNKFGDGYSLTIEVAVPPCRSNVMMGSIIKKYGEADFVRSSKEMVQVFKRNKDKRAGEVITYYYDYFGFEVLKDSPNQKVVRVVTHAVNYGVFTPKDNKAYYETVLMKNITVFHLNKKEVGRIYYLMEGGKSPIVIKAPPMGSYRKGNQVLDYKSKGVWEWKNYFLDNKIARTIPFTNHQMNGVAKGFHPNGKNSFVVSYKNGVLHGDVIRYSKDGKELSRQTFENGKQK